MRGRGDWMDFMVEDGLSGCRNNFVCNMNHPFRTVLNYIWRYSCLKYVLKADQRALLNSPSTALWSFAGGLMTISMFWCFRGSWKFITTGTIPLSTISNQDNKQYACFWFHQLKSATEKNSIWMAQLWVE